MKGEWDENHSLVGRYVWWYTNTLTPKQGERVLTTITAVWDAPTRTPYVRLGRPGGSVGVSVYLERECELLHPLEQIALLGS